MTAYETRAATEDEQDRLALLRLHEMTDAELLTTWTTAPERFYETNRYRPADKQGDVEPFDVQADWDERAALRSGVSPAQRALI